jgi:hypothetical protein
MSLAFGQELFADIVGELVEEHGFVPPLSMVGVADDGSMFGVHFTPVAGKLEARLRCQHTEVRFGLPMNVMVVDLGNRAARVLLGSDGERTMTVL